MCDDNFSTPDEDDSEIGQDILASDVLIPYVDFPPDMEEFDAENWEGWEKWDEEIDRWSQSGGAGTSPLGGNWNTLPFGSPGECKKYLFVDVRSDSQIQPLFDATIIHLQNCPETEVVVFHVGDSIGYVRWVNALQANMPLMLFYAQAPNACFATRLARSWTPRSHQKPDLWRGGICNGQPGVAHPNPNGNVRATTRAAFKHRIWLLEEFGLLGLDAQYKGSHTEQPTNPRAGDDISFGDLQSEKIQNWMARIYFRDARKSKDNHRMGFKCTLFHGNAPGSRRGIKRGSKAWIARPWLEFLKNPYAWIDPNRLASHR